MMRILAALLALTMAASGQGVIPKTATVVDGGHRYDVDTNGKRLVVPEATYTNAVLMMPFSYDDNSPYYDVSLAGNDGTQTTAGFRPARTNDGGGALRFDGVDDYIDLGNTLRFTTEDITLSAWIKTTDVLTSSSFLAKYSTTANNRSWTINAGNPSTNAVLFVTSANGADNTVLTGVTDVKDGAWHHVTVIKVGATATIYVDGVFDASGTSDATLFDTPAFALIGARQEGGAGLFDGYIDDPRSYPSALTSNQVYSAYMAEPTLANGGKR